jgi:hypothetical protein
MIRAFGLPTGYDALYMGIWASKRMLCPLYLHLGFQEDVVPFIC